jgi:hypothetical protein
MEDKKYYWMSFQMDDMIMEDVVKEHPFIAITKHRKKSYNKALLNWKELSKDDYDLFVDILYNVEKYLDDKPED